MKTAGILVSALLTAAFLYMGKYRGQDYYLAAVLSGFVFFRLATGTACPLVWLLSKLGVKGLACPTEQSKS
jgi:small basic protein